MSDLGFGRMPAIMRPSDRSEVKRLRSDYRDRIAAYEVGSLSTQYALDAAVDYIEELERWVIAGE